MENSGQNRYVIAVTTPNRIGPFSAVSAAIADADGNIDGLTQTVAEGYFTTLITATFTDSETPQTIEKRIREELGQPQPGVLVMPYEETAPDIPCPVQRYVFTLIGKDRPGLLKQITGYLEERRINITDWYVEFHDREVTHIGEILVPSTLDIKQTQDELNAILGATTLQCSIQHNNIFRATNDIGPIKSLVEESRNG